MKRTLSFFHGLRKNPKQWVGVKAALLALALFMPQAASAQVPQVAVGLAIWEGVEALFGIAKDAAISLATIAASISIVSYVLLGIAKVLLWVSAVLFNWSITTLVFGFSEVLGNSTGMLMAWSMLRDLGNILLLFGFVWIGIQMILNIGHHSAGKALPQLIIFAVLINFSLFAAEAVVDVSNGLTYGLYNQSVETRGCSGVQDSGVGQRECDLEDGVAGQILGQLNIISAVGGIDMDLAKDFTTYATNPIGAVTGFIMLAVLISIAAVVLFAGAFLFITRGVTLALLLVTSPIGFAGMAIPALNDMSRKWWDALLKNAFFAPVFLILLFVGLRLTDSLKEIVHVEGGLATALQSGLAINAGPIFLYMLVIGFLIGALMLAKQFSIMGAGFAVNAASAVTYGSMARGSNFFGGAVANRVHDYYKKRPDSVVGQVLTNRFLRPLQNANLDLRRIPGVAGTLAAGGATSGTKPAEHASYNDLKHAGEDIVSGKQGKALKKQFMGEVAVTQLEDRAHSGNMNAQDNATLASMNVKDLEQLHSIQAASPDHPQIAERLSPSQFDDLMKSDKLDDTQKGNLRTARFTALTAANTQDEARTALKGMSKSDLENIPSDTLLKSNVLQALTDKQRDDIDSSNKRTREERAEVKANAPAALFKTALDATLAPQKAAFVASANGIRTLTPPQVAKLDADTLKTPEVARNLTVAMLKEIVKENKLSSGTLLTIGNEIRNNGLPASRQHVTFGPESGFWN